MCAQIMENLPVGADAHIGPLSKVPDLLKMACHYHALPRGDVGIAPYDLTSAFLVY